MGMHWVARVPALLTWRRVVFVQSSSGARTPHHKAQCAQSTSFRGVGGFAVQGHAGPVIALCLFMTWFGQQSTYI
jgi:hypothetical protein